MANAVARIRIASVTFKDPRRNRGKTWQAYPRENGQIVEALFTYTLFVYARGFEYKWRRTA